MGTEMLKLQGSPPYLFESLSERQKADLAGNGFATCAFVAVLCAVMGQVHFWQEESNDNDDSNVQESDSSSEMANHFLSFCR